MVLLAFNLGYCDLNVPCDNSGRLEGWKAEFTQPSILPSILPTFQFPNRESIPKFCLVYALLL